MCSGRSRSRTICISAPTAAPTRLRSQTTFDRMYAMFPVLKQKARLPAGTLSGGQQQMLAIARALMGRPRLLLLDEPSMGLAPLLAEEIFNAVTELRKLGMTILLVEQNAHAALAIADHAYVMETGEIVLSGSGKELLGNGACARPISAFERASTSNRKQNATIDNNQREGMVT